MDAKTLLAISKFDMSKKVRGDVEPGTYTIDELVRISGTIKVGQDHEAKITASVPWQRLAAVLFDKLNGVTVESVLREALDGNIDEDGVKARVEAAIEAITGSTKKTRKGPVSVSLDVKEVV